VQDDAHSGVVMKMLPSIKIMKKLKKMITNTS
jgi:hypothetical protein